MITMDSPSIMDPLTECEGFDQLGLAPAILDTIQALGYEVPTPIQCQCIPHLLAGRDLLGQAQTGTGKTAAFALPLINRVDLGLGAKPQVLVLTPTRELALQVAEAFQTYARGLRGFHVLPLYGGSSFGLQARQLERGVQVIVGTPGRVMDYLRRGTLDLAGLSTLVLDEADEMLDMGFAEDIDWIFEQTPAQRQVALFSATMPDAILKVAQAHLRDPVEVRLIASAQTVETVDQFHCLVTRFHKLDVLTRVLEVETFDAMLIFVRTKLQTLEVAEKLAAHGFNAEPLNGDMTQAERERTVERLKRGRLDILVATDVAARGLDLERLSLVVNYDIPTDPGAYVHRIGRTGRAGREGRALVFVEPRERHLLRAIERTIRRRIPELPIPTSEDLSAHRIERFSALVKKTLAEEDLDFFYRLVARIAREGELEAIDVAAALTYLVQRDRPLQLAPAPEPAPKPKFKAKEARTRHFDESGGPDQGPGRREPGGYRQRDERRGRMESDEPQQRSPGFAPGPRREGGEGEQSGASQGRSYRAERGNRFAGGERSEREGRRADREYPASPPRRAEDRGYAERRERGPSFDRPSPHGAAQRPEIGNEASPPRYERPREGNRDFGQRGEARDFGRRGEERDFGRRGEERDFGRGGDNFGNRKSYRGNDAGLVSYRIDVGRRDGVAPREIVGAIANEAGIEGRFIGRIDIGEDYSLVDLPEGMPHEIFQHLRGVFVRGKRLNISLAGAAGEERGAGKRHFRAQPHAEHQADGGEQHRPAGPKGFKSRRKPDSYKD